MIIKIKTYFKNWKNNTIPIIIAVLLIITGVFCFLYGSSVKELERTKNEISMKTQRLELAKELLDVKDDVKVMAKLIEHEELSSVVDEITNKGDLMDIEFLSIEAKTIKGKKKDPYQYLPIHMSFRSGYKEIGLFLAALRNLEKSMVTIDHFKIMKNEQIAPRLESKVIAIVYLKNENDQ